MSDAILTAAMASDPSWPAKAVAGLAAELEMSGHCAPNTQGSPPTQTTALPMPPTEKPV